MSGPQVPFWLQSTNVSWRFCVLSCFLWTALVVGVHRSSLGYVIEQRFASPINFAIRHLAGRDVALTPRLKIYGVDDSTVFKLKNPVLSGQHWAQILDTLALSRPDSIFIDGMLSRLGSDADALNESLIRLRQANIPVTVGAFLSEKSIEFGDRLEPRAEYALEGMADKSELAPRVSAPMVSRLEAVVYGPDLRVRSQLAHIGHLLYNGDGLTAPLLRLHQYRQDDGVTVTDAVVGHVAMYLAKERLMRGGKLVLDGIVVPQHSSGYVTVNALHPQTFEAAVRPVRGLLDKAAKGQPSSVVQAGDIVLIVPQFYTGNADFKQTPFGVAPGALIIASMLNSVATGNWLKPFAGTEALTVVLGVLGAAVGMTCGGGMFWLASAVLGGVFFLCSQLMFGVQNIIIPWLLPLSAYVSVALTVFAEKTRLGEQRVQALRAALAGSVAPSELNVLLRRPEQVSFEARERVVTLMFIDIVGFSLLAEHMLPRIAFDQLKRTLAAMGEAVHAYGGVIDKTLGDGLLCYFGYRFDADVTAPDHAEKALLCAIKIQEDSMQHNLTAIAQGEPVYPLRIGINTASCYLGDLGSEGRVDFTVVGNGVNFAKRLEGACEMYAVLMGPSTYDLVGAIGLATGAFQKRFIRIKHHSELVESYEYDPFFANPHVRHAALEGFRKYAKIDRIDQRWPVHDASRIQLVTSHGAATLINFSLGNVALKLPLDLPRGERFDIAFDSPDGALKARLLECGMATLCGEVRWGYSEGAAFVHGVLLTDLSVAQQELLVQHLCEFAFASDGAIEHAS